jgi:hypothetical protein
MPVKEAWWLYCRNIMIESFTPIFIGFFNV